MLPSMGLQSRIQLSDWRTTLTDGQGQITYMLNKGTSIYSQAEAQSPLRQVIMFDCKNKSNKKQVNEMVPTWSQNWLRLCNSTGLEISTVFPVYVPIPKPSFQWNVYLDHSLWLEDCRGMFDWRIPTCCLSWVLCPSSSRTARCSQGLRSLCDAGLVSFSKHSP